MIKIKDMEFDFDLSSPMDAQRLNQALERVHEKEAMLSEPPTETDVESPTFWTEYIDYLNNYLLAYGNFLDDLFGDGVAEELLTNNPSVLKLVEVIDEFNNAIEGYGKKIEMKFRGYQPNRATRRAR